MSFSKEDQSIELQFEIAERVEDIKKALINVQSSQEKIEILLKTYYKNLTKYMKSHQELCGYFDFDEDLFNTQYLHFIKKNLIKMQAKAKITYIDKNYKHLRPLFDTQNELISYFELKATYFVKWSRYPIEVDKSLYSHLVIPYLDDEDTVKNIQADLEKKSTKIAKMEHLFKIYLINEKLNRCFYEKDTICARYDFDSESFTTEYRKFIKKEISTCKPTLNLSNKESFYNFTIWDLKLKIKDLSSVNKSLTLTNMIESFGYKIRPWQLLNKCKINFESLCIEALLQDEPREEDKRTLAELIQIKSPLDCKILDIKMAIQNVSFRSVGRLAVRLDDVAKFLGLNPHAFKNALLNRDINWDYLIKEANNESPNDMKKLKDFPKVQKSLGNHKVGEIRQAVQEIKAHYKDPIPMENLIRLVDSKLNFGNTFHYFIKKHCIEFSILCGSEFNENPAEAELTLNEYVMKKKEAKKLLKNNLIKTEFKIPSKKVINGKKEADFILESTLPLKKIKPETHNDESAELLSRETYNSNKGNVGVQSFEPSLHNIKQRELKQKLNAYKGTLTRRGVPSNADQKNLLGNLNVWRPEDHQRKIPTNFVDQYSLCTPNSSTNSFGNRSSLFPQFPSPNSNSWNVNVFREELFSAREEVAGLSQSLGHLNYANSFLENHYQEKYGLNLLDQYSPCTPNSNTSSFINGNSPFPEFPSPNSSSWNMNVPKTGSNGIFNVRPEIVRLAQPLPSLNRTDFSSGNRNLDKSNLLDQYSVCTPISDTSVVNNESPFPEFPSPNSSSWNMNVSRMGSNGFFNVRPEVVRPSQALASNLQNLPNDTQNLSSSNRCPKLFNFFANPSVNNPGNNRSHGDNANKGKLDDSSKKNTITYTNKMSNNY